MTDRQPRIVFFGTPEFAVTSLRALHTSGFVIAGVVTVPDRPAGRGRKIAPSPVKDYALKHNLTLLQPERLRDADFLNTLRGLEADIFVVVAFRMLPQEVWAIPPLGTFNLHASLLPQYRGAAPINHAIINGETETGVTTFLIDKEIDTGQILLSQATEILPEDNAGSLHDRLMEMGAALVTETAAKLFSGKLKPLPQKKRSGETLHAAPRLFAPDMIIDWREPAVRVHNRIRGLSPSPGAVATLRREGRVMRLKILESMIRNDIIAIPGTIITPDRSTLIISCSAGALEILSVQPEGRRRMATPEFLRGFVPEGWELA